MLAEKTVGPGASYQRRLGALSGLLCGIVALLGLVLVVRQPCAENLVALLACVGICCAGLALAHGN